MIKMVLLLKRTLSEEPGLLNLVKTDRKLLKSKDWVPLKDVEEEDNIK